MKLGMDKIGGAQKDRCVGPMSDGGKWVTQSSTAARGKMVSASKQAC